MADGQENILTDDISNCYLSVWRMLHIYEALQAKLATFKNLVNKTFFTDSLPPLHYFHSAALPSNSVSRHPLRFLSLLYFLGKVLHALVGFPIKENVFT